MPNHINNHIRIQADSLEQIQEIVSRYKFDPVPDSTPGKPDVEGYPRFPDFNKIRPMPDHILTGDLNMEEMQANPDNWYNWSIRNWGTKWNSYSHDVILHPHERADIAVAIYKFETAWSAVPDLIQLMACQNPHVRFEYSWADECTGYNTGMMIFEGEGIFEDYSPENGSKEAYDLAFEHRPDCRQYYDWDEESGDVISTRASY